MPVSRHVEVYVITENKADKWCSFCGVRRYNAKIQFCELHIAAEAVPLEQGSELAWAAQVLSSRATLACAALMTYSNAVLRFACAPQRAHNVILLLRMKQCWRRCEQSSIGG